MADVVIAGIISGILSFFCGFMTRALLASRDDD